MHQEEKQEQPNVVLPQPKFSGTATNTPPKANDNEEND